MGGGGGRGRGQCYNTPTHLPLRFSLSGTIRAILQVMIRWRRSDPGCILLRSTPSCLRTGAGGDRDHRRWGVGGRREGVSVPSTSLSSPE